MDMQVQVPARDRVVIGGSQGALEVLRILLAELPQDFPAAIMIVIHSGPSSPGYLADIIDRYTALPVGYAREGEIIESGRIYVAPADRHLEIAAPGVLHLSDGPKVRHSRPAADRLFTTAAEVFGPRVVCVVLSGGDCDGVQGANAVAATGGKCLVQEPQDAVVASMPISVIQRDHPDAIISKENIAVALVRLVDGVVT